MVEKSKNLCIPDIFRVYRKAYHMLTFLADAGMDDASLEQGLDAAEKERALQFKSDYFRQRFAVSRSSLKGILRYLSGTGNHNDIILSQEKKRILVKVGRTSISAYPIQAPHWPSLLEKEDLALIWK